MFMKLKKTILLIGVLTLLFACNKENPDWIVKVNKTVISKQDLQTGLVNLTSDLRKQIPKENQPQYMLNQLIQTEIIYQEALKGNLQKEQDYLDFLDRLSDQYEFQKKQALVDLFVRDQIDNKISIQDQEVSAAYDANKGTLFSKYERRSISHILLKDQKTADNVFAQLKKGANFSSLAKTKSIDVNTSKNGGLIPGYFRKENLAPEMGTAIFAIKKTGQFSRPVKSEAGFHIFNLNDTQVVSAKSLEDVKDSIKNQLYLQKRSQEMTALLTSVKDLYTITNNEALLEAAPSDKEAVSSESKESTK
ncbi:hypothetical protein DID78_02160 [Candidatus Marinamargulisbacteria bacterium SCGC AG-343-D04]|nr:hypothetical protein DID78_02160 [Candidatus Marinamargulisbacteria bacterium SCGC AG-343-D04]